MCLGELFHASAVLVEPSSTWEVVEPQGGSEHWLEAVRNRVVVA